MDINTDRQKPIPCSTESGPTEDASVDEVQQAEVLQQVVLDGSAGEEDPALGLELAQGGVRLVLAVFQPVALWMVRQ